jgi:hypothetical protein
MQQVIQETVLSRSLCVDAKTSLVASPFYESFMTKESDLSYSVTTRAKGSTSCDGSIRGVFDSVEHSIEAHVGVTDMIFDKMNRPKQDGDFIL